MPKVGGIVSHRRALSQFCFELCPCYVNNLLSVYFVKNNVIKFSVKQWIGFAFASEIPQCFLSASITLNIS